ncbi:MAG TPA: NAD-dependent epimerase/dehydratase family protein [Vicinamibacteria bacterium]|nr:NAD-dependent epimerase/dehydratase family protein [Vicinamibacteria bacterium]
MRREVVLVTGAAGEMGQALIARLAEEGGHAILAVDLSPLPEETRKRCHVALAGDILDEALLERLASRYAISTIFHLAAVLSSRGELLPEAAHRVNVDGTLGLLRTATEETRRLERPVTFLFPSSVAVYGLPDLQMKALAGAVTEDEWTTPVTMYGCNKLYCEHLGRYYSRHYRQLDASAALGRVDFRALRFPGLISAATLPSGGTSDYGPEMIHAAARGEAYACFVREDTRMPFMAMPDAIEALLGLQRARRARLTRFVYNVSGFSPTAGRILERVRREFADADVRFEPDPRRQRIVDSWPADQDDSCARSDWGFAPAYDEDRAFDAYLFPAVWRRYHSRGAPGGAPFLLRSR